MNLVHCRKIYDETYENDASSAQTTAISLVEMDVVKGNVSRIFISSDTNKTNLKQNKLTA